MAKVIVSTPIFTGHSTIFNCDDSKKHTMNFQCDDRVDLQLLPNEIKFEIFDRLILQLLNDRDIKKAFGLLFNTSFQYMELFYKKRIGRFGLTRSMLIDHVVGLYNFIEDIVSVIYAPDVKTEEELYLTLYWRNPKSIDLGADLRWPMGSLSQGILSPISAVNLTEHFDLKLIKTGSRYCDLVWLSGVSNSGVIEVKVMQSPIVLIEVFTINHGIEYGLCNTKTNFFGSVINLLKICLGKESAVYLVYPLQGFMSTLKEV